MISPFTKRRLRGGVVHEILSSLGTGALGTPWGDAQDIANPVSIAKPKGYLVTLDPLLTASLAVQLHVAFALVALPVGPIVLFRTRRDRMHKRLGYLWVVAMAGLALSGLWIEAEFPGLGPFGPIHLFSVCALFGLGQGLWQIRGGNVAGHRAAMQSVWFGAMGLAGLFTLLPERLMNRMLFGDTPEAGLWALVIGIAVLIPVWRWWRRQGGISRA